MPSEIYLVKVGMTMTEGVVDEWYVEDGGRVELGEPVYRLETEKVNMDVESDVTGTVRHLVDAGTTLEPGDVVGWIFAEDESIPDVLPTPKRNPNIAVLDEATDESANKPPTEEGKREPSEKTKGSRVLASPAARRLAEEMNVDLSSIVGTGPRGRITKEDVEGAAREPSPTATTGSSFDSEPLSGMRKVIAQRMFASLQSTAQLTMDMEVQMDDAVKLREGLIDAWQESGVRVTYTDLVVSASVLALQRHPMMNSTYENDQIHKHREVNLGIAIALDEGLVVPVIHDAHALSLEQRARKAAELAEMARDGKLTIQDVNGGTFTVTSLGMYGVDSFTPILNPPQTGILGVGRIYDTTLWRNEQPVRSSAMRLSLTWDHRVIDGAPAAQFLSEVKHLLESPIQLIV